MCCLESKISGGDPSVLINVFRVKTSGYDSPGPPYGSPRRTPSLGQTRCQGNLQNVHGGSMSTSRTSSTKDQKFGAHHRCVANSSASKFNFQKLVGTPPHRKLVSRRNL
ncbi:hypothetical protein MTR67_039096 [Solanum verrucosum]|uniref:Uncharacterized protein n=1 Tax=Solanum verrucosum TaxID=315347 RepID=A0AAF0UHF5_SOLVR|nr:hypothetical protein MTR67_039096 [Solanum verrucosum]